MSKKAARDAQGIFQVLVEQSDKGGHFSRSNRKWLRETRSLLGKIILETMGDGVTVGAAAANAHSRPKRLYRTAMVDLAIRQQVLSRSRDVSRKRTVLEMQGRHDTTYKIQASWRKENEALEKEIKKPRPAKMQKTISGNTGK